MSDSCSRSSKSRTVLVSLGLGLLSAAMAPLSSSASPVSFDDEDAVRWLGEISTPGAMLNVVPEVLGLENPWGFALLPDGAVLITERPGRLRLAAGRAMGAAIENVPDVFDRGQGGLLDVALDPDYDNNGVIYLSYAEPERGSAGAAVYRARLVRDGLNGRLEDGEVIFRQNVKTRGGRHFGSRITFDDNGYLFITIGDRGERDRAQNGRDHAGTVVRIYADGSVPDDNPFVDDDAVLDDIWSLGHRNAQGADINPVTGSYWTVEHGARGGDELNRPVAGLNYGWPVISYGRHYSGFPIGEGQSKPGLEQPVHYWDPSIAPSGLSFYSGAAMEDWYGDVLVGALRGQSLTRLSLDVSRETPTVLSEETWDLSRWGRVRDVDVDARGHIWFLTDEVDGGLFRIVPTPR